MRPTPSSLQQLDLDALVGQSVDEARRAVEDAGGVLRTAAPQEAVTLDYRPDRVTVIAVDGTVVDHRGIG